MIYFEGELETEDGSLFPFHHWWCPSCDNVIYDYDEEFEYPENVK
jgi:hypothetical protein